jgi:hypothetical protein
VPLTTRTSTARRSLGLTALTAAAAGAIALGALGSSADASTAVSTKSSTPQAPTEMPTGTRTFGPQRQAPATTTQQGFVVEGTGSAQGYSVHLSLYANSLHGNVLEVGVETPDGRLVTPDRSGSQPESLFHGGDISAQTDAITRGEDGEAAPAGTIAATGSYAVSGSPTRPNGAVRDDGEVVVTRGTSTPLAVQLTVTYGDVVVPVQVTDAFAFDLTVLAQDIGN